MKIELFGWVASIYEVDGTWYTDFNKVNMTDLKVLQKYIMFLELVEFHLRELNNE